MTKETPEFLCINPDSDDVGRGYIHISLMYITSQIIFSTFSKTLNTNIIEVYAGVIEKV